MATAKFHGKRPLSTAIGIREPIRRSPGAGTSGKMRGKCGLRHKFSEQARQRSGPHFELCGSRRR
ncbi:MAG: hypothetical protein WCY29_01355 [Novosphingobium sp.]